MSKKNKLTIIAVVAIAPVGYSPRRSTFKIAVVTSKMTPSIRAKYENKAIEEVRKSHSSINTDIAIKYSATSKTTVLVGVMESEE